MREIKIIKAKDRKPETEETATPEIERLERSASSWIEESLAEIRDRRRAEISAFFSTTTA